MIRMKLRWLTYDMLMEIFLGQVHMPNGGDSMRLVYDKDSLIRYKQQILNKYGDIIIKLDNSKDVKWFDKVEIDCSEFRERQRIIGKGIMNALNR